jgi:hypothetical protein
VLYVKKQLYKKLAEVNNYLNPTVSEREIWVKEQIIEMMGWITKWDSDVKPFKKRFYPKDAAEIYVRNKYGVQSIGIGEAKSTQL